MLTAEYSGRFKKDLKLVQKRGLDTKILREAILTLAAEIPLPEKFHDHALTGNWQGFRECHLKPDWLLVYRIEQARGILHLARTGTHSDLFR